MDELKGEKCPRISAEDLVELGELAGAGFSRSPTKKRQGSKPMIFIVDVRSQEEYPLMIGSSSGVRNHCVWSSKEKPNQPEKMAVAFTASSWWKKNSN